MPQPKFPENTFAIRGDIVCKLSHRGGVLKAISKHIRFDLQDNQIVNDYVGYFYGKSKIILTGACAGTYTKVDD